MHEREFKNWPAVSPAACKWQKNLLLGLHNKNIDFTLIYYRPDSYWPKGRVFPTFQRSYSKIPFKNIEINYLNLPFFKNLTKKLFLKKILNKFNSNENDSNATFLITYNAPKWTSDVFSDKEIFRNFYRIYLLADEKKYNEAEGYIILSFDQFQKCKYKNKLHYDGSLYDYQNKYQVINNSKKKTIFLYSGSFLRWAGVQTLLDAVKLIKSNNFQIWFSGYGNNDLIKNAAKHDKRIKYFGLLSEIRLKTIFKKADVFLNPRPVSILESAFNFPSKLFDYLSWQKPIISTFTKGLSPEYKKVLHISGDNPKEFAKNMSKYIDNNFKFKINKKFIKKKKLKNQTQRLIFFLTRLIKKK